MSKTTEQLRRERHKSLKLSRPCGAEFPGRFCNQRIYDNEGKKLKEPKIEVTNACDVDTWKGIIAARQVLLPFSEL